MTSSHPTDAKLLAEFVSTLERTLLHNCYGTHDDDDATIYMPIRQCKAVLAALSPVGAVVGREDSGWVIEHEKSSVSAPVYWAGLTWQTDNLKAVRFARKQDAEEVAVLIYGLEDDGHQHRICEHAWVSPKPPPDAGQPGAVSGAENAVGGVAGSADEGI